MPFQAELARLRAALDRLADPTQQALAGEPGQRWSAPLTEFLDWQQLALEGRQCAERLSARAEAALGPDPRDAAVGRLRREIAQIGQRAQAEAAQAAEAFARVCHQAAPDGLLHAAHAGAFLRLADRARRLRQQWDALPARPQETEADVRRKHYDALESLCRVLGRGPTTAQQALDDAQQLRHAADRAQPARRGRRDALDRSLAALHRSCTELRSSRLSQAVELAAAAVRAAQIELAAVLEPGQRRCLDLPADHAALLLGDPLPDTEDGAGNWQAHAQNRTADLDLAQQAQEAARRACAQCEAVDTLTLPDDAPPQAQQTLQVARLARDQMARSATITADLLTGLHRLGETLGSTSRADQAAAVRPHLRAVKAYTLRLEEDVAQAERLWLDKALPGDAQDIARHCTAALATDLRRVKVSLAALETLSSLLAARAVTGQELPRLRLGSRHMEPAAAKVVLGQTHGEILKALNEQIAALSDQPAPKAGPRPTASRQAEQRQLDRSVQALRLAIQCDQALIRSKVQLVFTDRRAPDEASDQDRDARRRITMAHARMLAQDLENDNQSIAAWIPASPHGEAYEAQIRLNNEVRSQLLTRVADLDRQLNAAP